MMTRRISQRGHSCRCPFEVMPPFDALTLMRDKMPNHFDKIVFSSVVSLFKR